MNGVRLATAGLGVALMVGCAGGCAAGTHPGQLDAVVSAGQLRVMTPAPRSDVGTVTWNVFEGEPQTIDPFQSADYTPNEINSNMCETLLAQTPSGVIRPNLAASVSNPDPLHWVYRLRTDVRFWDGSPMTAADVAWSLNHNLTDPTTLYSYLFANVKGIAVTGPHQVTVTLKRPDYLFNDELASFAGVVVEKKFFLAHHATFGSPTTGVMCTGPFEFSKWTQGQSITLTRNPHYWNTALEPRVHTLVFTFLTDDSAITAGLLDGQIDGTYSVPPSGYTQLAHSNVGTLTLGPAPISITLVYANPAGPMRNLDMRKALQLAIPWASIGNIAYNGTAQPLRMQTPPTVFGFAGPVLSRLSGSLPAPRSGDVAAARRLVARVPSAIRAKTIVMVVPSVPETEELGLAVEAAATSIGLRFQLRVVPTTGYSNYLYDPKTRAGVDILYTEFWPNIPNPMDWLDATAVYGGIFNQYGYTGVDSLFAQAQGSASAARRAQLLGQIETILHSQLLPMVPGLQEDNTVWMNKRITGAPAAFDYVFYPWAAYLGGTG
jgi:peptide/nickel transport system substrate-binding protein